MFGNSGIGREGSAFTLHREHHSAHRECTVLPRPDKYLTIDIGCRHRYGAQHHDLAPCHGLHPCTASNPPVSCPRATDQNSCLESADPAFSAQAQVHRVKGL